MLTVLEFQEYVDHCVAAMDSISKGFVVIDDGQVPKLVTELTGADTMILLGILPSYGTEANDEDSAKSRDMMSFLMLSKAERTEKHSDFIKRLDSCVLAAKEFRVKLIMDIQNYQDGCSFLTQLIPKSIKIDPIWNFCGMDGYEIYMETLSHIG